MRTASRRLRPLPTPADNRSAPTCTRGGRSISVPSRMLAANRSRIASRRRSAWRSRAISCGDCGNTSPTGRAMRALSSQSRASYPWGSVRGRTPRLEPHRRARSIGSRCRGWPGGSRGTGRSAGRPARASTSASSTAASTATIRSSAGRERGRGHDRRRGGRRSTTDTVGDVCGHGTACAGIDPLAGAGVPDLTASACSARATPAAPT